MQHSHVLESPIVGVNFAGFMSDTYTLHCNGWAISMEKSLEHRGIRLALQHNGARIYGLTSYVNYYDIQKLMLSNPYKAELAREIIFNVLYMFSEAEMRIPEPPKTVSSFWQPIDPYPSMTAFESIKFSDWVPFKTINPDAPEIYVDQKTIPELMDLIIKKQDPKQKEIREKRRKEAWRNQERNDGFNPRMDIQAQILSIAI